MNPPNFVNYHVLISHSPSCLNRDDMNMQKTAVFGGVKRVRISSQSLKRAMRKSAYYTAHFGMPSVRTRELGKLLDNLVETLKNDFSRAEIERALTYVSGKEGIAHDTQADAVAPWVAAEIKRVCEMIRAAGDDADPAKLAKQIEKESADFRRTTGEALDIALSGRMATSGLMTSIDGAMAVAHAITTHAVEQDVDWFTAVDDLVVDAGEVGAGHLNTQEFSAGVFYRYASLNLGQLQANLGGASRERALEIAAHLLHLLTTVVPSAKQQSFAAHNPADFALVSFADQPISLANAFEEPVSSKKGLLEPSLSKLAGYWQTVNSRYGLAENASAFSLRDIALPQTLKGQASLPALEAWVRGGGTE